MSVVFLLISTNSSVAVCLGHDTQGQHASTDAAELSRLAFIASGSRAQESTNRRVGNQIGPLWIFIYVHNLCSFIVFSAECLVTSLSNRPCERMLFPIIVTNTHVNSLNKATTTKSESLVSKCS